MGTARLVGFRFVDFLSDDSSLDAKRAVQPVHIAPFQTQTLANPETKANTQNRHGLEWLQQILGECANPRPLDCEVASCACLHLEFSQVTSDSVE